MARTIQSSLAQIKKELSFLYSEDVLSDEEFTKEFEKWNHLLKTYKLEDKPTQALIELKVESKGTAATFQPKTAQVAVTSPSSSSQKLCVALVSPEKAVVLDSKDPWYVDVHLPQQSHSKSVDEDAPSSTALDEKLSGSLSREVSEDPSVSSKLLPNGYTQEQLEYSRNLRASFGRGDEKSFPQSTLVSNHISVHPTPPRSERIAAITSWASEVDSAEHQQQQQKQQHEQQQVSSTKPPPLTVKSRFSQPVQVGEIYVSCKNWLNFPDLLDVRAGDRLRILQCYGNQRYLAENFYSKKKGDIPEHCLDPGSRKGPSWAPAKLAPIDPKALRKLSKSTSTSALMAPVYSPTILKSTPDPVDPDAIEASRWGSCVPAPIAPGKQLLAAKDMPPLEDFEYNNATDWDEIKPRQKHKYVPTASSSTFTINDTTGSPFTSKSRPAFLEPNIAMSRSGNQNTIFDNRMDNQHTTTSSSPSTTAFSTVPFHPRTPKIPWKSHDSVLPYAPHKMICWLWQSGKGCRFKDDECANLHWDKPGASVALRNGKPIWASVADFVPAHKCDASCFAPGTAFSTEAKEGSVAACEDEEPEPSWNDESEVSKDTDVSTVTHQAETDMKPTGEPLALAEENFGGWEGNVTKIY